MPWTHEPSRRAGTVHVGGTYEEIAAAEREPARGQMPERPFVLVCQQYLADPSRSDGDVHPLYAYAHVPTGCDGDATAADRGADRALRPGLPRPHPRPGTCAGRRHGSAHNPNYVGGDVVTGANDPLQMVFRPRAALDPYSLGVPGRVPLLGGHATRRRRPRHVRLQRGPRRPRLPEGPLTRQKLSDGSPGKEALHEFSRRHHHRIGPGHRPRRCPRAGRTRLPRGRLGHQRGRSQGGLRGVRRGRSASPATSPTSTRSRSWSSAPPTTSAGST